MPAKRTRRTVVGKGNDLIKRSESNKLLFVAPQTSDTEPLVKYSPDFSVTLKEGSGISVKADLLSFLDILGASTGNSTYYNSQNEQKQSIVAFHDRLFAINRGLYAGLPLCPQNAPAFRHGDECGSSTYFRQSFLELYHRLKNSQAKRGIRSLVW